MSWKDDQDAELARKLHHEIKWKKRTIYALIATSLVLLVSLFVGLPTPIPDYKGSGIIQTIDEKAFEVTVRIMTKHGGEWPLLCIDSQNSRGIMYWDGTIVTTIDPDVFEAMGSPVALHSITAWNPPNKAAEIAKELRDDEFLASHYYGFDPKIANYDMSIIVSTAWGAKLGNDDKVHGGSGIVVRKPVWLIWFNWLLSEPSPKS